MGTFWHIVIDSLDTCSSVSALTLFPIPLQTNRFIDVDFNCLDANVNLQTWVVLLDFLGMGAKIPDASQLEASMESDVSLPLTGKCVTFKNI